jgi:RimJ/RimL family protein N-acetyltransferase
MTSSYRPDGPAFRLVGEGLVLREWDDADLPAMVQLFDDPDIAHRTPLASPFDLEVAKAYLEKARRTALIGERIQLAITTDGVVPLGEVLLSRSYSSIGYAVGAAHRGQGLAVRAVRLLTDYAHRNARMKRVVLEIEADNDPSVRVAKGAGYRLTDTAPSQVADKGRNYSLLTWEHVLTN